MEEIKTVVAIVVPISGGGYRLGTVKDVLIGHPVIVLRDDGRMAKTSRVRYVRQSGKHILLWTINSTYIVLCNGTENNKDVDERTIFVPSL